MDVHELSTQRVYKRFCLIKLQSVAARGRPVGPEVRHRHPTRNRVLDQSDDSQTRVPGRLGIMTGALGIAFLRRSQSD